MTKVLHLSLKEKEYNEYLFCEEVDIFVWNNSIYSKNIHWAFLFEFLKCTSGHYVFEHLVLKVLALFGWFVGPFRGGAQTDEVALDVLNADKTHHLPISSCDFISTMACIFSQNMSHNTLFSL